eukprot:2818131-Amphidinium_carterae.1
MEVRYQARAAFLQLDADSRIRRALLRNRPADVGPWNVGDFVYFLRKLPKGQSQWCGLARVIGTESNMPGMERASRIWLRMGGTTILCEPQQLRRA